HPRRGQRPEPRFYYGASSRVLRNQDEVISARSIGLGSDAFDLLPESSLQVLAEADDLADPGGIPGWISVVEEVLRIPHREVAVVHEAFEVPEGRLASEQIPFVVILPGQLGRSISEVRRGPNASSPSVVQPAARSSSLGFIAPLSSVATTR